MALSVSSGSSVAWLFSAPAEKGQPAAAPAVTQAAEVSSPIAVLEDGVGVGVGVGGTSIVQAYRPVRQLPYELRDHIRVFLEERMYSDAIQLLASLLAAGGSDRPEHNTSDTAETTTTTASTPVWVPPPSHLAVLATLAVHPAHTTRPQNGGTDLRVAGHALQYLQHLLAVAGPVQADLARAFAFKSQRRRQAAAGRSSGAAGTGALSRSNSQRGGQGRGRGRGGRGRGRGRSRGRGHAPGRQQPQTSDRLSRNGGHRSNAGDYVDSSTLFLEGDEPDGGRAEPRNGYHGGDSSRENDDANSAFDDDLDDNGLDSNDDDGGDDDDADDDDNDGDTDPEAVVGRMATRDSVWVRGHNFWHVAGWALGCSVAEPARWRFWRPWLAYMMDVLEADLGARLEPAAVAQDNATRSSSPSPLHDTLLFQYLDGHRSHMQLRRIAAAILVSDGSASAAATQQQHNGFSGGVFEKETAHRGGGGAPSSAAAKKKQRDDPAATTKRVLDLDNFQLDDDNDEGGDNGPNNSTADTGPGVGPGDEAGYLESLPLRRRLVYLLVLASVCFPDGFVSTTAVYRAVAEVLREVDVSIYAAFLASLGPGAVADSPALALSVTPRGLPLPSPLEAFSGLLRHILVTYMPATAPRGLDISGSGSSSACLGVTPALLERCVLPFAANTVLLSANLRMALAIEALFRLAWTASRGAPPIWTASLQEAAEAGVRAREARVRAAPKGRPGRKPANPVAAPAATATMSAIEVLGQDLLQRSGRRLLAMVALAKLEAGGGV